MDNPENRNEMPIIATSEMRAHWGWFVALGTCLFVLGIIAAGNMVLATIASVFYVGALMIVGGILQIIYAFRVKTWGQFALLVLCGLLYLVAGVITCFEPLPAATMLTLLLGMFMIAAGIVRLWTGFKARPAKGWGWLVGAGAVTMLVGLMIVSAWPVNSLFILGLFLAVDLLVQGWSFFLFGLGLKPQKAA